MRRQLQPNRLIGALLALVEATKRKSRTYYYDSVNQKRWILDGGGKSGNCEECEENADAGWIGDDETFIDSEGNPIDAPPAHPNCQCELEFKERRVRVYV